MRIELKGTRARFDYDLEYSEGKPLGAPHDSPRETRLQSFLHQQK